MHCNKKWALTPHFDWFYIFICKLSCAGTYDFELRPGYFLFVCFYSVKWLKTIQTIVCYNSVTMNQFWPSSKNTFMGMKDVGLSHIHFFSNMLHTNTYILHIICTFFYDLLRNICVWGGPSCLLFQQLYKSVRNGHLYSYVFLCDQETTLFFFVFAIN